MIFNKKDENKKVESKTFKNDIVREEDFDESYKADRFREILQGATNSVITSSNSSVSIGLMGIAKFMSTYSNLTDSNCHEEMKHICQSNNNLNYENFVKNIENKMMRKSIISFVSETVMSAVINGVVKNKCDTGVKKVIYALNIPTLVGIVGGEAVDTVINKVEYKRILGQKETDQDKIEASKFYLGECKKTDGSSYTFTKLQNASFINNFVGSSISSILSASLTCATNIIEKRIAESGEKIPIEE